MNPASVPPQADVSAGVGPGHGPSSRPRGSTCRPASRSASAESGCSRHKKDRPGSALTAPLVTKSASSERNVDPHPSDDVTVREGPPLRPIRIPQSAWATPSPPPAKAWESTALVQTALDACVLLCIVTGLTLFLQTHQLHKMNKTEHAAAPGYRTRLGAVPITQELLAELEGAFGGSRKYFQVARGGDKCMGAKHWRWSFTCIAAEARLLNRTLVVDDDLCLSGAHNGGPWEFKPIQAYYNLSLLQRYQPIITRSKYHDLLEKYTALAGRGSVSEKTVTMTTSPASLVRDPSTVLIRDLGYFGFAYEVCARSSDAAQKRIMESVESVDVLKNIAEEITKRLGGDFDTVHVRRGDKARSPKWPNLRNDTSPEALMDKLPKLIPPGRTVYVATDETTPGFFHPLKKLYKVHVLSDFSDLWNETSAWYQQTQSIMGNRTRFDCRMKALVDYQVLDCGRKIIRTFNQLTNDPEHVSLSHTRKA